MTLPASAQPRLTVEYVHAAVPESLLARSDTLAVFGFGSSDAPLHPDPRYLRVPLQPYGDAPRFEHWRSHAPVRYGREQEIAWASDGQLLFGSIEVDELTCPPIEGSSIAAASAYAYAALTAFLQQSDTPHLLRVWNHIDAITLGDSDRERYRQFCLGRARGLGDFDTQSLPAATAVGRCDDQRKLQIYWLAARVPGVPIENPRQISAYHYPRQYGPQSPSFARAMLPSPDGAMPLLLSGTASVVGHTSQHAGELLAQLDETLANCDSLLAAARLHRPGLPATFGTRTHLKVYVRDRNDLSLVDQALQSRFGDGVPRLLLHAAICRRELAVEIDGVHGECR